MWVIYKYFSKALFKTKIHTQNANFSKFQDLRQYNSYNVLHRIKTKPALESCCKTTKKNELSEIYFSANSNYLLYMIPFKCPESSSLVLTLDLISCHIELYGEIDSFPFIYQTYCISFEFNPKGLIETIICPIFSNQWCTDFIHEHMHMIHEFSDQWTGYLGEQ